MKILFIIALVCCSCSPAIHKTSGFPGTFSCRSCSSLEEHKIHQANDRLALGIVVVFIGLSLYLFFPKQP